MTPVQIVDMDKLIEEQFELAREASSGRSAITIVGDHTRDLRQTLIAVVEGERLHDHDSPAEATLHILIGDAELTFEDGHSIPVKQGGYMQVPPERHGVTAVSDCAMLLTVATRGEWPT